MTVSMRVMSAGDGYRYLLKSVAAGDGDRAMAMPLTRYYAETGCPPGRWVGAGLEALASEAVLPGNVVTEAQLERLIGLGLHPVTGEALGAAYIVPAASGGGRASRDDPAHLGSSGTSAGGADVRAPRSGRRRPVAGYDYTFSVPKSVSVLWGLADAGSQELLVQAHHD